MGRILEVRDRRLGRSVAIKEVLHGDESAIARFEREIEITARLQHPAIVHVHEAGRWPNGTPFYVMKLIRGKPLDVRIAAAKTLRERLELLPAVTTVVDALAYAHSEGVIHRDLKPANVLVGDFGETIVIDWGIAKALGEDETVAVTKPAEPTSQNETVVGAVIGTPSYMPPEQAAGDPVDRRADVYSLGALLYQVLGGVPPFFGRTTAEVLSRVLDEAPRPLSEIDPEIPIELVAIVEKAMSRKRSERFPSANEMAIELKRFQQGKLVESHRYTKWELIRRWLRRYRAAVSVAAIALATLGVIAFYSVRQIGDERDRANEAARIATEGADQGLLARAESALDRDPTQALALLKELSPNSIKWPGARSIASDAASRGVSDVLLDRGYSVYLLVYSPDGSLLAEHGINEMMRIWDLRTHTARIYTPMGQLFGIAFENNESIVGLDFGGTLWRWNVATGTRTQVQKISVELRSATLSPDAKHAVVFEYGSGARLVDFDGVGTERQLGHYGYAAWAPDSSHVVLVDRNEGGRVDRFDLATGTTTVVADKVEGHVATDGEHVWVGAYDVRNRHAVLHDVTGRQSYPMPNHITKLAAFGGRVIVATDPLSGTHAQTSLVGQTEHGTLASFDPDKLEVGGHALRVADLSGAEPVELRGHDARVQAIAISRNGDVATGDNVGGIRLWHVPPIRRPTNVRRAANRAFLSEDKRQLAVSHRGPTFEVHDLTTGAIRQISTIDYPAGSEPPPADGKSSMLVMNSGHRIYEDFSGAKEEVVELARPARGNRFATIDQAERVILWDLDTTRGRFLLDHVKLVAISPSGDQVATQTETAIQLWDVATRKLLMTEKVDTPVSALALGPRGMIIAANEFRILRLEPGQPVKSLPYSPGKLLRTVVISADGNTVLTGGDDGLVTRYFLAGPRDGQIDDWIGHRGAVVALAFSPDESHVASSSSDRDVRVWSSETGSSIVCSGHTDVPTILTFDQPDAVISAGLDRTTRVCDLRSGYSRSVGTARAEVVFAAHVGNGSRVVTVDRFHQLSEYPDNLPEGDLPLRAWLDSATNVTVDNPAN